MNVSDTKWVKIVLDELNEIKEDLLTLYEDIETDGDKRDSAARRETLAVLSEFDEKLEPLERAVDGMIEFIERVTGISAQPAVVTPSEPLDAVERERVGRLLDTREPHTLDEYFTHKKPAGFTLLDQPHIEVFTWTELHRQVLAQLAQTDPDRFKPLPAVADFNRNAGTRFSTDPKSTEPKPFRKPLRLPYGLYCEGHLSAGTIRDNIRRLLAYFSIPESEMVIYLREDRNAE